MSSITGSNPIVDNDGQPPVDVIISDAMATEGGRTRRVIR